MNQCKVFILTGAAVLLYMSAAPKRSGITGLTPGDTAPRIENLSNNESISFTNTKGQYTLLNFWAAYDAASRKRNVALANAMNGLDGKVVLQSVSFDSSQAIFEGVVKMDSLKTNTQHIANKTNSRKLFKEYALKKGFTNYLIDAEGTIVAKNVSPEEIKERFRP
jgi:hypothetical protein